MGDTVEAMLRQVMTAIMNNDRKLAAEVSRMDNIVDRSTEAIKLYIARLTRGSLDEREGRRAMEIVSFAINLEHVGDIIDKNLCELAIKKIKRRYQFSRGRRRRADDLPQAHLRELTGRLRRVHDRRCGSRSASYPRESRATQHRTCSGRKAFRAAARRPARKHRDKLVASRHPPRSQAHSLAHLFGRLSSAGSRRRIAGPGKRSRRGGDDGCAIVSPRIAMTASLWRVSRSPF